MQARYTLIELKRAVHLLSETDRARLRTYLIAVFDVRGRDTRVNLLPDERDRPRD
jgi:hypothetical protein